MSDKTFWKEMTECIGHLKWASLDKEVAYSTSRAEGAVTAAAAEIKYRCALHTCTFNFTYQLYFESFEQWDFVFFD